MRVCPHGVSQEVTIERNWVAGNYVETWRYNECLKCTERQFGQAILARMFADKSPPILEERG